MFCRRRLRKLMYQNIKLTCAAIALLIKPFVWWRCHCRRRRELLKFSLHLRPWQTRTHYCGHIVADTNVSPFTRARLCPGHKKMFLILFRRILCPLQMFPSLRSPRNIMGNNVSSFTRAFTLLHRVLPLCQTDRSEISGNTWGKWKDIFRLNWANQ